MAVTNNVADLSPQDSTLLSDVVEVGRLPCFTREDGEFRHNFYILTCQGLRYECSSVSKIQVHILMLIVLDQGECLKLLGIELQL